MLVQGFHEKLLTKNTIRDCHRDKCFRYNSSKRFGPKVSCSFVSIKYMCTYISYRCCLSRGVPYQKSFFQQITKACGAGRVESSFRLREEFDYHDHVRLRDRILMYR